MKRGFIATVVLLVALLAGSLAGQGSIPTLIADETLFSDGERNTLLRDADLAQRAGVPIMFVVIAGNGTSAGSAQTFADTYRQDFNVESAPGADDGIVFLTHWVGNDPAKSTVVYSAGEHAFETTGLSDETINAYLAEHVLPILHSGQLFGANAWLMRFTRYTSLYVPPPVAEITGVTRVMQQTLAILAPLLSLGTAALLFGNKSPSDQLRWRIVGAVLTGTLVIAGMSVWTHSRIGIGSVIAAVIALAVWCLWVTRDRPRTAIPWREISPDIVIALILIGISLSINFQHVESTPIDRDETRWINRAYYAADLADPFGPTWQDYSVTVGQPPLGSIAMGVGLALQNQDLRAAGVWDYQYGRDWYVATGMYPSDEALRAGRSTNAVIGALATGAAFVLGRLLTNRVGGIAAGAYLAWHPLHIVLSTQALSDETFALLLLLALIAAWQFASKPTWARAIILGVFLGLGGATKLTPLLLAPPLALFGILRFWLDKGNDAKRASWMLIAQPVIAFATFVAVYPWSWPNPIERTVRLFTFRAGEMDAQTNAWPNSLTETPFDALARFGHKLTYTHSTTQKALQSLYDWIGIERTAVGLDLVFAAAGAVLLLGYIARTSLWTPQALVGALLFGELAILAIGMNADFYRYHLPVVMIASACIAMAVGTGWDFAWNALGRREAVPATSVSAEVAT